MNLSQSSTNLQIHSNLENKYRVSLDEAVVKYHFGFEVARTKANALSPYECDVQQNYI